VSRPTRPEPRVVAIVAAYNEADVIDAVLDDLIRQRVEVYFIDNRSTDDTFERAEARVGRGVIGVERFPAEAADIPAFDWAALLRRKEELATELDADWFIHHDADEFREAPWENVDLRSAIARVDAAGYNAIDFAVFNFRPEDDRFVPGSDVRSSLRRYERSDWWDSYQIKCWKRLPGIRPDLVSKGGHEALFPGRAVFPLRFLLLHFPIRSQAHGERKIGVERLPRYLDAERRRGWHLQYDALPKSFLWQREELHEFDGVQERIELAIHNRRVDELRHDLLDAEGRLAAAHQANEELRRALAANEAEESERARRRGPVERQLEQALRAADQWQREIRDHDREIDELTRKLGGAEALRQEALRDGELFERRLRALSATLDDLLSSTSWRVTAPLRLLSELLRRRGSGSTAIRRGPAPADGS